MDEKFEAAAELVVGSEDTELMVGEIGATGCERGIGMSSSDSREERQDGVTDARETSTLESLLKRSSSVSSPSMYKDSFFGEAGSVLGMRAAARFTGARAARAVEVRHSLLTTTLPIADVFKAFQGAVASCRVT
jgi:hypothetical protein